MSHSTWGDPLKWWQHHNMELLCHTLGGHVSLWEENLLQVDWFRWTWFGHLRIQCGSKSCKNWKAEELLSYILEWIMNFFTVWLWTPIYLWTDSLPLRTKKQKIKYHSYLMVIWAIEVHLILLKTAGFHLWRFVTQWAAVRKCLSLISDAPHWWDQSPSSSK